jgi:hypothetical protein
MTPKERQAWIVGYLRENPESGGVDALNAQFEEAYCKATGADHTRIMPDVRALYAEGRLKRTTLPSTMPYAGCCKWVRHYFLPRDLSRTI